MSFASAYISWRKGVNVRITRPGLRTGPGFICEKRAEEYVMDVFELEERVGKRDIH